VRGPVRDRDVAGDRADHDASVAVSGERSRQRGGRVVAVVAGEIDAGRVHAGQHPAVVGRVVCECRGHGKDDRQDEAEHEPGHEPGQDAGPSDGGDGGLVGRFTKRLEGFLEDRHGGRIMPHRRHGYRLFRARVRSRLPYSGMFSSADGQKIGVAFTGSGSSSCGSRRGMNRGVGPGIPSSCGTVTNRKPR